MSKLTHLNQSGEAHMVDVGAKDATHRVAVASGRIAMNPATFRVVAAGQAKKGDVLGVARIASAPYADPKAPDWTVVDVEPAYALREPVTLDRIKQERAFADMVLVRQSRLSVQPVRRAEFDALVKLGGQAR